MKKNVLLGGFVTIVLITIATGIFFYNKKIKDVTLTNENVQEKIGVNLKWFSAAYLGEIYGWPMVYNYKNVTDSVTIPGVERSSYAELYELEGAKSKENMKNELAKYVDSSKFDKLKNDSNDFLNELKEYNGNVYWINGGVGDGPEIDIKTAEVISSKDGISKVRLTRHNLLIDMKQYVIVTVEYKNGKYIITDWSESD